MDYSAIRIDVGRQRGGSTPPVEAPAGAVAGWDVGVDITGTNDTILGSPVTDEYANSFTLNGDVRYYDSGVDGNPSIKAPSWGLLQNNAVDTTTFMGVGWGTYTTGMHIQHDGSTGLTYPLIMDNITTRSSDLNIDFEATTNNITWRALDETLTLSFDFGTSPHTLIYRVERTNSMEMFIDGVSIGDQVKNANAELSSSIRFNHGRGEGLYWRRMKHYGSYLNNADVAQLHAYLAGL